MSGNNEGTHYYNEIRSLIFKESRVLKARLSHCFDFCQSYACGPLGRATGEEWTVHGPAAVFLTLFNTTPPALLRQSKYLP